MIEEDVADAQHAAGCKECLSCVPESNGGVVRKALFDQDVTVEARHFLNCEHANRSERLWVDVKDLAIRDVCLYSGFRRRLNSENRDRAGFDLSFQRSSRDIRLLSRFHEAVHDQLILHGRLKETSRRGVPAMK